MEPGCEVGIWFGKSAQEQPTATLDAVANGTAEAPEVQKVAPSSRQLQYYQFANTNYAFSTSRVHVFTLTAGFFVCHTFGVRNVPSPQV